MKPCKATGLIEQATRELGSYSDWIVWLEGHGIAIVGPLTDRFDVTWLVGFVQSTASRPNSLMGFAVLVFILVMLGLLEVDDLNSRLRLPGVQPYGEKILPANREIGGKLPNQRPR